MLDQIKRSSMRESSESMDIASELPSSIKTYLRSSQFPVTSDGQLNDSGDFIAEDVSERPLDKPHPELSFEAVE